MIIYVVNKIYEQYCKIWDLKDNRLNHMPFVSSPLPLVVLILSYLLIIRYGEKWMQHRQPMKIDGIIAIYNLLQIIYCFGASLVIICYIFIVNTKFSILCQPISYKTDRISLFEAYLTYGYFFLKFNHFLDTVFFILRKKSSQVTFLHVYHHIVAVIGAYIGVLFVPGGHSIIFGLINCIENGVMYTYYFLFISAPIVIKSSVTVKKSIVRLQIASFCAMAIHFGHILAIPGHDCGYNKYVSAYGVAQSLIMIALFIGFYWSEFVQKKKQQKIE